MINYQRFKSLVFILGLFSVLAFGCKMGESPKEEVIDEELDISAGAGKLVKINNVLFSVPSPIQIAQVVKESGANYSKEMLNSTKKASTYTSNFKKALNLGIYGADLGYVTMYDQTQDAIDYLDVIKTLTDELGISGAFEKSTIERFQNNIGKKDSVLAIITEGFRNSDAYLKNNERREVGALVVAGGWIEGLYYASQVAKVNSNKEVINRVGEQKVTLENLIKLLMEYQEEENIGNLIDELLDLSNTFGEITFSYVYEKPTIDTVKKLTIINSKSEVTLTSEHLTQITEKIKSIRTKIVE